MMKKLIKLRERVPPTLWYTSQVPASTFFSLGVSGQFSTSRKLEINHRPNLTVVYVLVEKFFEKIPVFDRYRPHWSSSKETNERPRFRGEKSRKLAIISSSCPLDVNNTQVISILTG